MVRLASAVRPQSYWRTGYNLMYLVAIGAIGLWMQLPWWASSLLTVVALGVYMYYQHQMAYRQPLHLTAPAPTDYNYLWQLLFAGRAQKVGGNKPTKNPCANHELWEAKLLRIRPLGHCVHLTFAVVHPQYQQKYVVIWQDQVTAETWRQLNVLARWS